MMNNKILASSLLCTNFLIFYYKSKFEIDFLKCKYFLKLIFLQCNILFKYVSSIFYQRENKFVFFGEAFKYTMIFML
jgi:hypothetical protein